MKSTILLLAVAIILSGCTFNPRTSSTVVSLNKRAVITIKNSLTVRVTIARSNDEKIKGLSGRTSLGEDEGMLFISDTVEIPRFWMKGMLIPIDILWLNKGKIVDITHDIPIPIREDIPLPTYSPIEPIQYVLEVNAGWAKENGVEIGDQYIIEGL